MNIPIRLIAILPMLLLAAALVATACESAVPDDASQGNAIAAAAPTTTPTPTPTATVTPTPEHTQTPTATPDPLNPPTPQACPPGEIPVPITVRDGIVYMPDPPCIRLTTPTPLAYPKLDEGLNQVVEALESGASILKAASLAESSRDGLVVVIIGIDRDPRELVMWLHNNGAEFGFAHLTALVDDEWLAREGGDIEDHYSTILLDEYIRGEAKLEPPYKGGRTSILAEVPVSLLVRLSQQAGVIRIGQDEPIIPQQTDVPPAPQEPQDTVTQTPTPRATSQALSTHGVTS